MFPFSTPMSRVSSAAFAQVLLRPCSGQATGTVRIIIIRQLQRSDVTWYGLLSHSCDSARALSSTSFLLIIYLTKLLATAGETSRIRSSFNAILVRFRLHKIYMLHFYDSERSMKPGRFGSMLFAHISIDTEWNTEKPEVSTSVF